MISPCWTVLSYRRAECFYQKKPQALCTRHLRLLLLRRQDSRSARRDASLCEELRPGACEESCRSKRKKPEKLRASESCGGRTRTCDLQVMSLASYQLLHSAMLIMGFSRKALQRYCFFTRYANFSASFFIFATFWQKKLAR